ncbi:MAG: phosphotransferase [Synechococcaceae cyanobacterium]|nr:phosphotransferase [Synechococcaceae cyanobacterium]
MSIGVAPGQMVGGRYRLERRLGGGTAGQGDLWQGCDTLASEAPVALRRLGSELDQDRARAIAARLQGVLHPQVPRFGAAIAAGSDLWLVREWQVGRTYAELQAARAERQLVFGAGEVLLLLRQLLPVLAALHSQDLLHGDLCPANLLRRDSDGLPVLLDFGLVRGTAGGGEAAAGTTPGYAPPELVRGEPAQPWMDLHALGVVALVLLSGDGPETLVDPVGLGWRWPAALDAEPALAEVLQRLLSRDPRERFASAGQAVVAVQAVPMPDSTGPVPRADRTVALVPRPEPPAPPPGEPAEPLSPAPAEPEAERPGAAGGDSAEPAAAAPNAPEPPEAPEAPRLRLVPPPPPTASQLRPIRSRSREEEREEAAEGGLWPVLIALVLSAVAGTALGWWWLGRGSLRPPGPARVGELPNSLPPAEVDQRQQLLNRLRALQIDRAWFLRLVDAALLAQFPERRGRPPGDSLEDAPLRRVWNEQAEEWLARVEQLPLALRQRLGSFSDADWTGRQQELVAQGLSPSVLRQLVSGSARNLLPGHPGPDMPPEPFRQLWYAAAQQTLESLRIEPITAPAQTTQVLTAEVPASGARLFAIRLPPDHGLALGVNGTPLLQMSLFAADGRPLAPRGPLRVVTVGSQKSSPVQLLVTNEGVAPTRISLSLRADPPPPPAVPEPPGAGDPPPPDGSSGPPQTPEEPGTPGPAEAPALPEATPPTEGGPPAATDPAPDGGPPPR